MRQPTAREMLDDYAQNKRKVLRSWAKRWIRDLEDRDDCIQDALVRASATIDRYDPQKGEFGAWLRAYVRTACMDYYYKRKPEVFVGLVVMEGRASTQGDIAETLGETQEKEQQIADLHKLLSVLPPDIQQHLWQHSHGHITLEEVASDMGCTSNAAAVRLFRVRQALKQTMKSE